MEVVAAAPRCQLLLIVLMAAMLLPGMKGSPLLVRRKIARTMELQDSIGKAVIPALRTLMQKDCREFEASTAYTKWRDSLALRIMEGGSVSLYSEELSEDRNGVTIVKADT
ncbi:hypothetical protein STEG23_030704, partial [Scotinomys teguina]